MISWIPCRSPMSAWTTIPCPPSRPARRWTGYSIWTSVKNLFLRNAQKTAFYLLMIPGTKKFRTAALSKQIGSARLSFAEPEFMEKYMDLTPGSVTVLGLMNDKENQVRLLIDRDVVANHPFIGCHPCINTSSLKLPTADVLEKFLPAIHHDYTLVELPDA